MMSKFLLFLLLIFSTAVELDGQGLIFDDEAYSKLPRQSMYGDGSKSENKALDSVFKVDLTPFCPTVQHQGSIGSCVGWSVGYAAHTIQNAIAHGWANKVDIIDEHAFSAMFIFNQIKLTDCDYGARIGDAFEFLMEKGNIPSSTFDEDHEDCYKIPSDEQLNLAAQNTISNYLTLFGPEDPSKIKVNKTKLSLIQNKPVVIGMEVKKNFYNIKRGEDFWYPEIGNRNPGGGHAMVVVGFDDGKKAFEIMNSWGELWGNNGFIWINYDDFGEFCKYGFQFYLKDIDDLPSICFGNMVFRKPSIRVDEEIIFSEEALVFDEFRYKLEKDFWNAGDVFQLLIRDVAEGTYVYAFSYDADNKITCHWPRDEKLDHKFQGLHESALITVPNVELVIPGPYSALKINESGIENICILFSRKPILDFDQKMYRIRKQKGAFYYRLKKVFRNKLVPLDMIIYEKSEAHFVAHLYQDEIIPLILEITPN